MIDVEISVTPVGTCSTSISDFVAASEKALEDYPDLHRKITGMATEFEGNDIDEIFKALKEMHMAQINSGAKRVISSIRIDDRRDKECTLSSKIASVQSKIK